MSAVPDAVGTLQVALDHATRLLATAPVLALEQAQEILRVVRDQPEALLIAAIAHGALGEGDAALRAVRRAVALKPATPQAWLVLAQHLAASGDDAGAENAYTKHLQYSTRDPQLMEAATALAENRIPQAEQVLRNRLRATPTDIAALRMLAEVAARLGRNDDAEHLLERCLELAPDFVAARQNYAMMLHRANKSEQALAQTERLLAAEPGNASARNLKAAVLCRVGDYSPAIELYDGLLRDYPNQARLWLSCGHALKTAGLRERAVSAYRRCIDIDPGFGEAYWSLANLKTFRFEPGDVAAMREQIAKAGLAPEQRSQFEFALGKALEDSADYAASFEHYASGNAQRRMHVPYSADDASLRVRRSKSMFTREFFAQRAGVGDTAPDPIFIIGLPRSGSTLIEQILSSHSAVEGTMELPEIIAMTRELRQRASESRLDSYHEMLATLPADALRDLGAQYLERTRIQRKTPAPFFIDKMPNNFFHVGLIHLALPNAKIIDARRHPLACCFSGFKQYFARGQNFSYSLHDIGRYYRDYVELMAHFDDVLPGRVHRVIYEQMVENTEQEVRALLDYCGLPFEAQCLRFFENDRPVRTASSEQVRQPIYREGVDHWRHYEPWLGPLKEALGQVLDCYPVPPAYAASGPPQTLTTTNHNEE